MPIIGSSASRYDEPVEKVTHETNTSENWALILDICDSVKEGGTAGAKEILLAIKKRLNNRDPHVVLLTLSLLDSCMSNCGTIFKTEAASKEFVGELKSKSTGSNHKIGERTRQLLKRWVDEEYLKDPMLKLSLLVHLYNDLKSDGYDFLASDKAKSKAPSDPNYASSQEEAEDIAKAIQLSLKESGSNGSTGAGSVAANGAAGASSNGPASTLYPSNNQGGAAPPARRIVKALYDFEAAEDNELTFTAAELITVIDDSDVNWWKGSNHRGEGLFPASFVTSDLTAPVEEVIVATTTEPRKKSVQFNEEVEVKTLDHRTQEEEEPVRKIDEAKLDWCLNILQDADPTGDRPDPDELPRLEDGCHAQGPLIDKELEAIDALSFVCALQCPGLGRR